MHIMMTTKTVCGKCGSENWEGFQRPYGMSGIRCLSCGHEKINQPMTAMGELHGYAFDPNRKEEF